MVAVLQILLHFHNEGRSIAATMREIYDELGRKLAVEFLICEDGSTDDTKAVLSRLSLEIPMKLILSDQRKGYAHAVLDGMLASTAPFLLCMDSDGQCDPSEFWKFWELRRSGDVLTGWRVQRADNWMRRAMSRMFYFVYKLVLRVPVHDPSCSYVLGEQRVYKMIAPRMREMSEGFWWEFTARTHRGGLSVREMPIAHRARRAGKTQVFPWKKLPGIGHHHFLALFKVWSQTRRA
jgi:dolichol-phosphate mannosyltransferase